MYNKSTVDEDEDMLEIFKTQEDRTLKELSINTLEPHSWINLIRPNGEEIKQVAELIKVDDDFLRDALDIEERSRIELADDTLLIITNVPVVEEDNNFDTLPLGIVMTKEYIITVSLKENNIISIFNPENSKAFDTTKRANFLFQILNRSTKLYLRYLKRINNLTDQIENGLRKTMKNKALFHLFEVQKSLVYFTTALKDNGLVLEKLRRHQRISTIKHILNLTEEEEDMLDDVIIENKQALEMVEMHRNILESMMDAFASIISNNVNIVMKFLTSVTIILAVPTMIASFWGMNVGVPFNQSPFGFAIILVMSLCFAVAISFILFRKGMF